MSYTGGVGTSSGGGEGQDNDDAMRLAFAQFMLQGKSNNTKNNEKMKQKEEQQKRQKEKSHKQNELKKAERKYWSIFHKFCNILQNQWMDLDDQLLEVVHSLSHIRQRLPMEEKLSNRLLSEHKRVDTGDDVDIDAVHDNDWKCCGHNVSLSTTRSSNPNTSLMKKEDIELAFTHDLIQHEKMMEGLRALFSNLSEMHEALSRTLDEMTKHHLYQEEEMQQDSHYHSEHYSSLSFKSYLNASSLVDLCNDLFHMLSMELYRKQSMANIILNSADDRILLSSQEEKFQGQDDDGGGGGTNLDEFGPRKAVNHCFRDWPRSCDQSSIDNDLLSYIVSLHEKNNIPV